MVVLTKFSPCQSHNVGGVAGVRGRQGICHTDKVGFSYSCLQYRMLTRKGQILPGWEACQVGGNRTSITGPSDRGQLFLRDSTGVGSLPYPCHLRMEVDAASGILFFSCT